MGCNPQQRNLAPLLADLECAAYNTIDRQIDTGKVYMGGRYFLGLAKSFYSFPTTYQNIEFSTRADADAGPLIAQTSAGAVTLDVSIQYQLDLSKLVETYTSFELKFQDRFVRIAQSALQGAAARVTSVEQFYTDRIAIQDEVLFPAVVTALAAVNAKAHDLQLRRVQLPAKTEQEIIAKQVRRQEEETARRQQVQGSISSQTSVEVTRINKEIDLFQSNKTALARILLETAEAEALRLNLNQQSLSFESLRTGVGLTGADIVRLRFLTEVEEANPDSTLLVNFDDSTLANVWA